MKTIRYFLLSVLCAVFFSCEEEEPIPTHILSTVASPVEGGIITVSPSSTSYPQGQSVTLTPQANANWVFKQWEGDGSGTSVPLTISMISNKSVVGVFVKKDYPLNIQIEGDGTVTEVIVTNPSGREYPHGTRVELTPVPKEGWQFESWGGDLSGNEIPKQITVDKEKNVTVKFKSLPIITSLDCQSSTNNGELIDGEAAININSTISYTGGNGGAHSGQTVTSTGVTGLTATLTAGTLSNGSGSLTYTITGTPSTSGTASFALNIGGQTCTLSLSVEANDPEIVFDIDGNEYKTVRIGYQLWMAEDLRVTKFNDGEEIPTGLSSQQWLSTRQPAYAEIIPNPFIVDAVFSKGLQYNGYAAGRRDRLCPVGWSVASYSDWQELIEYLGGYTVAGGKLMSITGYVQPGVPGPIVNASYNSSGFSALPSSGFMNNGGGVAPSFGGYSDWWSPVDSGPEVVDNFRRGVSFVDGQIHTTGQTKTFGYCVRCIKN